MNGAQVQQAVHGIDGNTRAEGAQETGGGVALKLGQNKREGLGVLVGKQFGERARIER